MTDSDPLIRGPGGQLDIGIRRADGDFARNEYKLFHESFAGMVPRAITVWLVFHDHIEDSEFVSAHLTEAGAAAVVLEDEDRWIGRGGAWTGGKRIERVTAT